MSKQIIKIEADLSFKEPIVSCYLEQLLFGKYRQPRIFISWSNAYSHDIINQNKIVIDDRSSFQNLKDEFVSFVFGIDLQIALRNDI